MMSLISALALAAAPTTVTVEVTTDDPTGTMYVQLCDRDSFLADGCAHQARDEAQAQMSFTFDAVEPGEWAVMVWRDPESDGEMRTGMFGVPLEPTAISRNPPAMFGPPQFDDAKLDIGAEPYSVSIQID